MISRHSRCASITVAASAAALLAWPATATAAIQSVVLSDVEGLDDRIYAEITVTPDGAFGGTVGCVAITNNGTSDVDISEFGFDSTSSEPVGFGFFVGPLPPGTYSIRGDCFDYANLAERIAFNTVTGIQVGDPEPDPDPGPNGFRTSIELLFGSLDVLFGS